MRWRKTISVASTGSVVRGRVRASKRRLEGKKSPRRGSGHVDPLARRGRCLARRVRVDHGHRRCRYRPAMNLGESVSLRSMAPPHGSRAMGDPRARPVAISDRGMRRPQSL